MIFRAQQLAQYQADHIPVADHVAGIFQRLGFRGIEQRADHDRSARQPAHLGDESVLVLCRARRAPQNDLLGKPQVFRPNSASNSRQMIQNELGILISRSLRLRQAAALPADDQWVRSSKRIRAFYVTTPRRRTRCFEMQEVASAAFIITALGTGNPQGRGSRKHRLKLLTDKAFISYAICH